MIKMPNYWRGLLELPFNQLNEEQCPLYPDANYFQLGEIVSGTYTARKMNAL